ncbi:FecR domain-containing protein [Sulfuriferula thiophila]|uniref:FecR domain-containing protein n=1 Tax=Sulfuriferula thiophila TaxID=1781211 RepID=UPI000F60A1FA|nr:FecR domain-containing protein [Sulfuriferula thiophila]
MRIHSLLAISLSFFLASASYAATSPPDALTYTTRQGDTLIEISKQLTKPADWKKIQLVNHIHNPKLIPVGSSIQIPVSLLRSEDAPAKVISVVGTAQLNQQPLTSKTMLVSGSEIITGNDGFVLIQLANGTKLAVQADSHVTLAALKKYTIDQTFDSTVKVQKGRIETEAAKTTGTAPRYRIMTPSAVMSVRGTQFRVAADATQTSRTEVTEGLVRVGDASDSEAVGVAAGYGNIVDNGKPPMQPIALLPAPDISQLPALLERPTLRFNLIPLAKRITYRAIIADDEKFDHVLRNKLFDSSTIKFDGLADGKYWLRVRAVDQNGLEGLDAQYAFALKARPEPPFIMHPINKGKISGDQVTFNWALVDDANSYHLQLSTQPDFSTISIDANDIKNNEFTSTQKLTPGQYFWRIASIRGDHDQGPYGDLLQFTLKPMPALPPPPEVGANSMHLSWPGEPGQTFELDIAQDRLFTEGVQHHALTQPEITLPKPIWGTFFFRIRATDADGYVNPYTATQRFELPLELDWFRAPKPAK